MGLIALNGGSTSYSPDYFIHPVNPGSDGMLHAQLIGISKCNRLAIWEVLEPYMVIVAVVDGSYELERCAGENWSECAPRAERVIIKYQWEHKEMNYEASK